MIIYRWVKRYLEVYEEQKSLQDENNLHHKKNQVRNKGIVGKEKVIPGLCSEGRTSGSFRLLHRNS